EPFGPELTPGARDKGIGGGGVKVAARIAPGDEIAGRIAVGAELERLAESVKEQGDNLRALDRLMARAGKALAALPSRWPVRGGVNSEFGNRLSPWTRVTEFHSGLDINARPRTPVRAGRRHGHLRGHAGAVRHHDHPRPRSGRPLDLRPPRAGGREAGRAGPAGPGDRLHRQHGALLGPAPSLRDPGEGALGQPPRLPLGLVVVAGAAPPPPSEATLRGFSPPSRG